ncbi:MAG: hypothetical protein QM736_14960 [Vicinamibacterales bacterium]
MRAVTKVVGTSMLLVAVVHVTPQAQSPVRALPPISPTPQSGVATLVSRLDLERYKATVKGLTQFGDRRQGTERNRKAVDWIEAQLRSYGCRDRAHQVTSYDPPPPRTNPPSARPAEPAIPRAVGGGRPRGVRTPTGVNTDPQKQPNEALRALNAEPATNGPREEVYCTKVGTTRTRTRCTSSAPHGRARMGRSGQRRWLGDGAGDGARAHLLDARRADRADDPLRALEQRGDRAQRRRRCTSHSGARCRERKIRPDRDSIPSRSGSG